MIVFPDCSAPFIVGINTDAVSDTAKNADDTVKSRGSLIVLNNILRRQIYYLLLNF
jgi:hypothetical protein